jgi:hypothetical protein
MMDDLFAECHIDDLGDPVAFEKSAKIEAEAKRAASATKTKSRRQVRRAKSEEHLATILPALIETGDAWHVLSNGDIDSLSYLAHALKNTAFDHVLFSTWCMAMDDVIHLGKWVTEGKIGRLEAYVGEIFPNQYAAEYEALCNIVRPTGGRVCTFKNHSKIYACKTDDYALVIESSANINTNPRCENTVLTADETLYDFQKEFFDSIKSFNRNFDGWTPAE